MSTFNYFGLTYNDVIRAFPGADEDNFDSNDNCGREVIIEEMKLKEGELGMYLSDEFLGYIDKLSSHEVTTIELSGSSAFAFDFVPDFKKKIKAVVTAKCNDSTLSCADSCTDGETLTYALSGDTWYGLLDRVITSDEKVQISYSVDKSQLSIPSLKSILRDMVACVLGNYLYSTSTETWPLVEIYCSNAQKMLDMIKNGWVPPEFKSLDFVDFQGSFIALKGNRLL